MPCQITIRSVNGIVPIGGAQPTRVRVTGNAIQCAGGVLVTFTNTVNGGSFTTATPAPPDGDGRYLIDETFPAGFAAAAGDAITAHVFCAANVGCYADIAEPLKTCDLQIRDVQGFVPPGSLTPTGLTVTGVLFGFVNNAVDLTTSPAITAAMTSVPADPRTGLFSAVLPLAATPPGGMPLQCGDDWFKVDAVTTGAPPPAGCGDSWRGGLSCPQCFRAQIAPPMVGACAGNPPLAPVTFTAHVALPANGTGQFEWRHLADGTVTGPFPVTVAAGAPAATVTISEGPHDYPPGTHTVELRRTDIGECPPVQLTFTVACAGCPTVQPSVVVGQCVTAPGATKDHRPVTYQFDFNPQLGTRTASGTLFYGGPDANGATQQSVSFTGNGPHTAGPVYLNQHPGGYASSAALLIQEPNGAIVCTPPLVNINFSTLMPGVMPPVVNVDACLPCPTAVTAAEVMPPAPPLAAPHHQLKATVTWAPPAPPPPPPSPAFYDWTVTLPGGQQATILNGPEVITTAASPNWRWTGPAADTTGGIDPAKMTGPGTYAVSVVAKFALNAGLPSDPATGVSTCNLTGSTGWNIPGPTPPTTTTPTTPTTPAKGQPWWCDFLLVLALVLHLIGAIVLMVGICLTNPYVIIAGAAILVLAWIVFALWVWLCAAITPCSLLYTVFCIIWWMALVVAPVLVAVMGIIGLITGSGWCTLGAAMVLLDWALLLGWYTWAMVTIAKCPYINCFAPRPAPGP